MKIEEAIKQDKFHNPLQKVVINLLYTANWVHNKHADFFKTYSITPQQFNILRILKGQYPNKISASEIKSRMIDKNSDVSRLLDRLELKKLISKTTCPSDKRATDVLITDDGLELLQRINKEQHQLESFISLSDDQAEQLSNLLDQARNSQD